MILARNLLFTLLLLLGVLVNTFSNEKRFDKINMYSGLSHNSALCLLEDHDGFVLKSKSITNYYPTPEHDNSLNAEHVLALLHENKEKIWIGTNGGGVQIFNPIKSTFENIEQLENQHVRCFYQDSEERIWIGCEEDIFLFVGDKKIDLSKKIRNWNNGITDITFINKDSQNNFWIGIRGMGLYHLQNNNLYWFNTSNGLIYNHMYIGARFYSNEKHHMQFMQAAGKYLDIVSTNYYNHWTPEKQHMTEWATWTGRPFIVTEYYTKGEDSGMGNISGAGWIVRTQEDRGLFYQNYNLALLESKNCVGWHYFKYQDNDPTAKGVDPSNVDANKGIVSNRYVPWTPMLEKMKEMNTQVYNLVEHFDKN